MKIAVPREIKNNEFRVALTPAGAHELTRRGHEVYVEASAGVGSAIPDEEYLAAGAKVLATADDVWSEGELVLKVKEPIAEEYPRLREGQVLFTYLHLAADRPLPTRCSSPAPPRSPTRPCRPRNGALPLLAPMSEVAGRLAPQVGAYALMKPSGGRGVLPGGVPGVHAGQGRRHRRRRRGPERGDGRGRHGRRCRGARHQRGPAASVGPAVPGQAAHGHLEQLRDRSGGAARPTW